MQRPEEHQLARGQNHTAEAPAWFVQMPPKGDMFEVQPNPNRIVMEHKARMEASLRALHNKVMQLKQQQQQVRASNKQHNLESQQQQGSATSGSSTCTETSLAAGTVLQDAPAAYAASKDQQHYQRIAVKQHRQGAAINNEPLRHRLPARHNSIAVTKRTNVLDLSDQPYSARTETTDLTMSSLRQHAGVCQHQPGGRQLEQTRVRQTEQGTQARHVGIEWQQQGQRQQASLPHNLPAQQQHQSPGPLQQSAHQQQSTLPWQLQEPRWQHQIPLWTECHQQVTAAQGSHQQHMLQHQQHMLQPSNSVPNPRRQDPTAVMWQRIDLVRKPLLQVYSRFGNSSCSSDQLLTVLSNSRYLDLRDGGSGGNNVDVAADVVGAVQSEVRLQRAWKQLQITGGATAPCQQRQYNHQPLPQISQMQQQQAVPAAFEMRQLASQYTHARSERLQQRQFEQQHKQLRQEALSVLRQAFPALQLVGPCGRVRRAAAAAAARIWQPAAEDAAEEAEEQAHAARVAALECSRVAAAAAAGFEPHHGGNSMRAGKPPVPRPARKQLTMRLAEDDPNWKQSRFMSVLDQPIDSSAAQHAKYSRPEHHTAKYAVLTMLHGAGWPNHMFWQHWVAAHPPGQVALCVHMKAGVSVGPGMLGHAAINAHRLKTSLNANWGDISLVEATIDSIAEILTRCPHVTHIALASGHDVPVSLLTPGVLLPGVSSFGMYQFGEEEHTVLQEACIEEVQEDTNLDRVEAHKWSQALTFHHQWMVLSREHAAAVVKLRTEITVIGRVMHKACNSVKADMAPDEFIIATTLRTHGYIRSIQRVEMREGLHFPPGTLLNCYPTMVIFPAESSPHPVCWTDPDEAVKCQLEDEATMQRHNSSLTLRRCLGICQDKAALFFRKVEIRQTNHNQQGQLLSLLGQMWAGRSVKAAGSRANSSGGSASRGCKRKRAPESGKVPAALIAGDGCVAASPTVSYTATDGSNDQGDMQDVQSPVKKPASAQAMSAMLYNPAAAAAAAGGWPPPGAWPGPAAWPASNSVDGMDLLQFSAPSMQTLTQSVPEPMVIA